MVRDGFAETVFSCIKRMFGREYVTAIRFENMIREILLKASLYNWFRSITVHNYRVKENKKLFISMSCATEHYRLIIT